MPRLVKETSIGSPAARRSRSPRHVPAAKPGTTIATLASSGSLLESPVAATTIATSALISSGSLPESPLATKPAPPSPAAISRSAAAAAAAAEDEARKQLRELTLPNLITLCNAACGFYALTLALAGDSHTAAACVWVSAFLDALDGRVARWTETTTLLGKELDSLADAVTFVVVPAFLMYAHGAKAAAAAAGGYRLPALAAAGGYQLPALAAACAAFVLAGVFRLARFNVTAHQQSLFFLGIPTTLAAMAASAVLAAFPEPQHVAAHTALVAALAYLMISRWEFPTFKDASAGLIAAAGAAAAAVTWLYGPSRAGVLLTSGYLAYGVMRLAAVGLCGGARAA